QLSQTARGFGSEKLISGKCSAPAPMPLPCSVPSSSPDRCMALKVFKSCAHLGGNLGCTASPGTGCCCSQRPHQALLSGGWDGLCLGQAVAQRVYWNMCSGGFRKCRSIEMLHGIAKMSIKFHLGGKRNGPL
uniref:Uncharacterized protein n=1 Tax=Crocodylus porosus TaxID=8502 RepID=A0A7M4EHQ2_CROPO